MRIRWAIATVAALALAFLTLNADLPAPGAILEELSARSEPALAATGARPLPATAACPAGAKAANLNFTLKDMNGKNVRLADFKGKVILLDFWATWCIPCKVEIPWFVEFQKKYGAKGFQAIGVSVDDTVDKLKPYVTTYKMNYPVLLGLGHDDVQDAYGPMWGIPVTALISRDGRVCDKHTGMWSKVAIENEIKALLEDRIKL